MINFWSFAQIQLDYEENKTLEYDEVVEAYKALDKRYSNARLIESGPTDSGRKLKLFLIGKEVSDAPINILSARRDRTIMLINNGIHAGESCGIDASILFAQDILETGVPENVFIVIVPAYNIGGVLNRNCCTRANQDGPDMHGFRGNARNLDLNRDFIKADALNTTTFHRLFHQFKPHIFVDTHTSNGADYQYTLTLISTQKDKLNPEISRFLTEKMEPELYDEMKKKSWEMVPYVNVYGNNTPDKGYNAFLETPRYASGYTTLFNTIGFITETHMLKPYKDRVESTRVFLNTITNYAENHSEEIQEVRERAWKYDRTLKTMDVDWELDKKAFREMEFKGYEYDFIKSEISGRNRLKYFRNKPKTYNVKYFDSYTSSKEVEIPEYYIVPSAWHRVIELLHLNKVYMLPLEKDTTFAVHSTYISNFKFGNTPYEGHFPLRQLSTLEKVQERKFWKGDVMIPTDQRNVRFIVSVLEAEAVDSYLRWNFYDEIFQQKEGFSAYVFEDTALELLKNDPELKKSFEKWKEDNPEEAKSGRNQLLFIYKKSEMYEKEHLRYPVAKIYSK
jgi:hypothetical protein